MMMIMIVYNDDADNDHHVGDQLKNIDYWTRCFSYRYI